MNQKEIKFIILILATLNLQIAFCQSKLVEEEFIEYSKELAMQDFETALKFEKLDSLKYAIRHYRYVARFDSTSEIGKFSKAKLDAIWRMEKAIFQNHLIGKWNWIWSGTNYGTENSPKKCNCQKYWEFKTTEIIVFENNKEVERFAYEIEKDFSSIESGYFFINVNKGEKRWQLSIYPEVRNSYYLAERSHNAKLFLSFRDDGLLPNCVCGCPEKRFEKR